MHVHVYTGACIYVCTWLYLYMYVCIHMYMYCVIQWVCSYMYMCTCTCTCICNHVADVMHMYMYIHVVCCGEKNLLVVLGIWPFIVYMCIHNTTCVHVPHVYGQSRAREVQCTVYRVSVYLYTLRHGARQTSNPWTVAGSS